MTKIMSFKHQVKIASLLASTILLTTATVSAQDAEVNQSVKERANPDYDASGVTAGGFMVMPSLDVGTSYNDNIYAKKTGKTSDSIITVNPSLMMNSNWNRHAFNIFAKGDLGYYSDESSEDYKDYSIGSDARFDISTGTTLTGAMSFVEMHEDRGAPDSVGSQEAPSEYSLFTTSGAFKRDLSIFSLGLDAGYKKYDYDDVALIGGGLLNNDDRDRDHTTLGARLGYEIGENTEAYVRVTGNRVEYTDSKQDGGPQRNSDGYEAVIGAALDITGKTTLDAYVGIVKQQYDSATFEKISDVTFGLNMLWNPSQMTSVIANVNRSVQETSVFEENNAGSFVAVSGILSTAYTLRVERELKRNILLEAGLGYSEMDFKGSSRSDNIKSADIGISYLFNRNLRLLGSYKIEDKSVNVDRGEFKRNVFMINLKAQW